MTPHDINNMFDYGTFVMTAQKNIVLDRDGMVIRNINDHELTDTEKEIATQLIRDGYYGTFDELITTVRKLANE